MVSHNVKYFKIYVKSQTIKLFIEDMTYGILIHKEKGINYMKLYKLLSQWKIPFQQFRNSYSKDKTIFYVHLVWHLFYE